VFVGGDGGEDTETPLLLSRKNIYYLLSFVNIDALSSPFNTDSRDGGKKNLEEFFLFDELLKASTIIRRL
jgi:hypothetical protein